LDIVIISSISLYAPLWFAFTIDSCITNYQTGDTVFFNDILYEAIAPSFGNPPDISPLLWKVVPEEDVSAKYCTFVKVIVQCDLNKCAEEATFEAFCTLKEHICDDSILCKKREIPKGCKVIGDTGINSERKPKRCV